MSVTAQVSGWSLNASSARPSAAAILNETAVQGKRVVIQAGQTAFYLRVDDGVMLTEGSSTTAPAADRLMITAADGLGEIGFKVPDRNIDAQLGQVLGYDLVKRPARLQLPAKKAALLHDAMTCLLGLAVVCVEHVHSLVGIWIWGALLRRELLCVPHAIFGFLERSGAVE